MKIYTKTGDGGETSLYGGERRSKASARVTAYGEVDELQATLGVVVAHLPATGFEDIGKDVLGIQDTCFTLSAQLARPEDMKGPSISEANVAALEKAIDGYEKGLPALRAFILQGGTLPGAFLHQARTICRRAERSVVHVASEEHVEAVCVQYLNRLSDLLFVMARTANHRSGVSETEWHAPKEQA